MTEGGDEIIIPYMKRRQFLRFVSRNCLSLWDFIDRGCSSLLID